MYICMYVCIYIYNYIPMRTHWIALDRQFDSVYISKGLQVPNPLVKLPIEYPKKYTYIHIYIFTYIHIYIYTYIHISSRSCHLMECAVFSNWTCSNGANSSIVGGIWSEFYFHHWGTNPADTHIIRTRKCYSEYNVNKATGVDGLGAELWKMNTAQNSDEDLCLVSSSALWGGKPSLSMQEDGYSRSSKAKAARAGWQATGQSFWNPRWPGSSRELGEVA